MSESLDSLIFETRELASSGDLDAAFSLAVEAVTRFPNDARAWSLRAYINVRRRDYVAAVDDVGKAIDIRSDEPVLFFDRGRYHLMLEHYRAAVEDFNKGLELCDQKSNNYYREALLFMRAEALARLGRPDEALADLAGVREDFTIWTFRLVTKKTLVAECLDMKSQ